MSKLTADRHAYFRKRTLTLLKNRLTYEDYKCVVLLLEREANLQLRALDRLSYIEEKLAKTIIHQYRLDISKFLHPQHFYELMTLQNEESKRFGVAPKWSKKDIASYIERHKNKIII